MEERRGSFQLWDVSHRIMEEEKNATIAILNHLKEANSSIAVL